MRLITNDIEKLAMRTAYAAHDGQYGKDGLPYILHPIAVNDLIDHTPVTLTETEQIYTHAAALLHDIVEDTDVTISDLQLRFPKQITDAVALLTHEKNIAYVDYILALCNSQNKIAIAVKIADLTHNLSRCIGKSNYRNLEKRYRNALKTIKTQCNNFITDKKKG